MRTAMVVALLAVAAGGAHGRNLVANPSAEQGEGAPAAWRAQPAEAGAWPQVGARFGGRCLAVDASRVRAEWRSEPMPARAVQGYRLSGWVKSEGGSGWIEARFADAQGRVVAAAATPRSSDRAWRYAAVEVAAAQAREAVAVTVACVGEGGRIAFDGIRLSALDVNLLRNPALDPVMIGDEPDPAARPAGWHALPGADLRPLAVEAAPTGERALRLGAPGPAAAASYLVDLPADARLCALRAAIETEGAVDCALSWFGPQGWIKDDTFQVAESPDRPTAVSVTAPPPAEANRVRVTFRLAQGEAALVRPESLTAVTAPPAPQVRVFANQVGCEPQGRKIAIVASNFFPARPQEARFAVTDAAGRTVFSRRLAALGRVHEATPDDWGYYYWLADFSGVREEGSYQVEARVGEQAARSYPFAVGRGEVFRQTAELTYRFLYYQRCGTEVPGWHGPCHLDDAKLPDGSHADLAGGWHDAGDYNKWMYPEGPPLVLYGLASAYLAHREYFDAIDRDGDGRADLLDEILWGGDWLLRMRNPHTGGLYGSITTGWSYWGKAENETDNIPGNEDDRPVKDEHPSAALAAAALAKIAAFAPDRDLYQAAAIELATYAREKEGPGADRLLAELALWQLTGGDEYLQRARECADAVAGGAAAGRQGRALAALARFVAEAPQAAAEQHRRALEDAVRYLATVQAQPFPVAAGRSAPTGDMREGARIREWGFNMAVTANAWAALAAARALGSPAGARAGLAELDWLFGVNPLGLCMFEGVGWYNPPAYHHRYFDYPQHRRGAVPGAIPNGIARPNTRPDLDLPDFDYVNRDAKSSEPWIPYTGYYLLALAEMEPGE